MFVSYSVYYQIQQVFGHLMDSRLQYHEPERFWKVFKLWGETIIIVYMYKCLSLIMCTTRSNKYLVTSWTAVYSSTNRRGSGRCLNSGEKLLSLYLLYKCLSLIVCTTRSNKYLVTSWTADYRPRNQRDSGRCLNSGEKLLSLYRCINVCLLKCLHPDPTSVWSPHGQPTTVPRTGEVLEGV